MSSEKINTVATLSSLIASVLGSVDAWDDESISTTPPQSGIYCPSAPFETLHFGPNSPPNEVQYLITGCDPSGNDFDRQHQPLPPFHQVALQSNFVPSCKPQFDFGVKSEINSPAVHWGANYCDPVTACESIEEHMGGFCFCSPKLESGSLENVVEIKIENSKNANNEMFPSNLFDVPYAFNVGEFSPEQKMSLGYSREQHPFWGLTVEQRQTQQTTYRYYPRSNEPPHWQGWPLDMPSGEGSIAPPDDLRDEELNEESTETPNKSSCSKKLEGKTCGVCGDKALGYNFNAVTCESCKAFFRRNALKNKEFRCPFNDCCEVTAVTRRFCQRCRLRKCFEIGMKKEWIMSEEEKKRKRKKIEENRARKIGDVSCEDFMQQNSSSNEVGYFDEPLTAEGEEQFLPKPSKPQAVVVGRVRLEEPGARKKRKFSDLVDAHGLDSPIHSSMQEMNKSMPEDFSTSIVNKINFHRHSPLSHSVSAHNNVPLDLAPTHSMSFSPSSPNGFQFSSHSFPSSPNFSFERSHSTLLMGPCENALTPPKEGLVADLLRTQSQGSAELDHILDVNLNKKNHFEHCSNSSSESNYNFDSGVIIKVEKSDIEDCHRANFRAKVSESHPRGMQFSNEKMSYSSGSCATSEPDRGFEFNIKETLVIASPGCKNVISPQSSSGKDVMDSILNSAIHAEYSGQTMFNTSNSLQLNSVETLKINELLEASRGLTAPLCEDANFKDLPNPSLINVINLTEIAIRRLIKMSKKIGAFKNLCQEDQIALLKAGCTEMMILRSVYAYDPDKDVWKIQQDHERFKSIKLKVLKSAPGNVYEEHKRFMLEFEPEWRQDLQIMALLSAIALFTPQRANVVHPDAVEHEQKSYFFLLKRYLESRYGGCIGKTNYYRLLKIIAALHVLNEDHVRVFLDVNPKEVEPLLIEIFDLKRS